MRFRLVSRLAVLCVVLALCGSCTTEADLCRAGGHPHRAAVSYEFGWNGAESVPDSMIVLAKRVINQRKCAMIVSAATGRGRFIYGAPDDEDVADSLSSGIAEPADTSGASAGGLREFSVPAGTYKFQTFNMDTAELVYDEVDSFLTDMSGTVLLQDIYAEYKSYDKSDSRLRGVMANWQDYNPYARYIQPDIRPLFLDTTAVREVGYGHSVLCGFLPEPITQNIDIYFTVRKSQEEIPFAVDSVVAEISGIPARINLSNGYLDITRTNKMMFRTEMTDAAGLPVADTYGTDSVRCHAGIDVPCVVGNSRPDVSTGPGILQVVIYVHADSAAAGGVLTKKIQGKINLYNTLRNAGLTVITDDGRHALRNGSHGVLDIKADLVVDGKAIVESPDNNGGIDRWLSCDDIIVDI